MAQIYGHIIGYVYPSAVCFQSISIYVTVSACVQCYLCVRYTVTQRVTRMPPPTVVLPFVLVFAVLYNFIRIFEVRMVPCFEPAWNATSLTVST